MYVCQVCASSSTVRLWDITPSCRVMFFIYVNIAEAQSPWVREKNSLLSFTTSSTRQRFPRTQTHRLEKRADEIFLCEWQIITYRHRRKNDGFSALFIHRTRTAILSSWKEKTLFLLLSPIFIPYTLLCLRRLGLFTEALRNQGNLISPQYANLAHSIKNLVQRYRYKIHWQNKGRREP